MLIVLLLGISQTSTFRDFLRTKITDIASSSLNGNLHIEKIDGTILTSLSIKEISLTDSNNSTIFYSGNIEIKLDPFQLLTKKILIRDIIVKDAQLSLLQNEKGIWNIETLGTPSEEDEEEPDEESSFPFIIQVNNLDLNNMRFIVQTYENRGNNNVYRHIDFDDLLIDQFNLSAKAIIDLSNNNYSLNLNRLSFNPNVELFTLKEFSGIFVYQNKDAVIRNFKLTSDDSNIRLNAKVSQVDFFDDFSLEKLQSSPVDINFELDPFVFDDLSSFIPVTDLLGHKVELNLKASGPYGNLYVEQLDLKTNNTSINVIGNVKNLHIPDELFLDVNIINSFLSYDDASNLLPGIDLPKFGKLSLSNFNTAFKGTPTNFTADIRSKVNEGTIEGKTKLNLDAEPMEYDVKLQTTKLNLAPIIGDATSLNMIIDIIGSGVSPEELNSRIDLKVNQSSYADYKLDQVKLYSNSGNKIVELSVDGFLNNSALATSGFFNFTEEGKPKYDFEGKIENLNLTEIINNEEYDSDLNFYFDVNGHYFNLDSLYGMLNLRLDSSRYVSKIINDARLSLQVVKNESNRNIYLNSDFVDFTIVGDFSLENAVEILAYEAKTIGQITSDKIDEFNPLYKADSTIVYQDIPADIISKELDFEFSFTFKDFELIAVLLGEEKLDIAGSGRGSISNKKESFTIETDLIIDYFLSAGEDVFYISDLHADFKLTRDNTSAKFDDLFGAISLNCDRIYAGGDIEKIQTDIVFNQSRMFFNVESIIDKKIGLRTDGRFIMSPREQDITLEGLTINYNNMKWENIRPINLLLKPGESLDIQDFSLYNDPAALFVNGIVYNDGRQNLQFNLKDVDGLLLSKLAFESTEKILDATLNVTGYANGTFSKPILDIEINLDDISYGNVELGNLIGNLNYSDKNITINSAFTDTTRNIEKPKLTIDGNIPIDLNYQLAGERFSENDLMSLKIYSKDFDLAALGNVLPVIKNQKGFLTADIDVKGTINNPRLNGKFELSDTEFTTTLNNLDYRVNCMVNFDGEDFEIEQFTIANAGGTANSGTMKINGSGLLDGFIPESAKLLINGDLAILGQRSRSVQPLLYGDLFIETDGDWVFNYKKSGSYFFGNVNLVNTRLTFVTEAAGYDASTQYQYTFIVDTTKVDRIRLQLEEIIASDKKRNNGTKSSEMKFDYELNISTKNIAELEIILAQAFNQTLSVEALGSLKYESIGGRTLAQGSFQLLDGSKLEFFKTFEADGSLRFETDITDPYLDIVATYRSDYTPPNSTTSEEVAVKLKLQGPVSELGTNLANQPENISVYVGSRNIENNIPDERYDASDAVSFILVNQFKADLSAENRQDVANQTIGLGTATSLLGPILTGFVNSAVGDVVNNIQLSQAGEFTKFAVSGRFSKFRYSFGGTTEVFQNINKANLRLDYLFNPSFLIRLERKDPIVRSFGIDDKITELGLKYRFEF